MRIKKACIFIALVFLFLNPATVHAATPESGISAMPKFRVLKEPKFDYRIYTLRKFFRKYNSPLTPYSTTFIKMADYYELDWRMVPAISGVESTFGKRIPPGSYNAYGWANGKSKFISWPHSISTVTRTLRKNYVDRGAVSINRISKIYAPPSNTWGKNVTFFVGKISPLHLGFDI
jgi:hypothetical protein